MKVQMEWTFPDREKKDLEQLNALLGSAEWSEVEINSFDGYHASSESFSARDGKSALKTNWYGFSRMLLECSREAGEQASRYQVETEYLPPEQVVSADLYCEWWLEAHPDKQIMQLYEIAFKEARAFVILSREKTEDTESEYPPEKTWILDKQLAAGYQKHRESCSLGNFAGEPIEWLVMEKMGDACLLVSKYALTLRAYDSIFQCNTNWEKCALRQWLNKDFYSKAFSSQEQQQILLSTVSAENSLLFRGEGGNAVTDKIFLLSIPEATRYFTDDDDRICLPGKGVDTERMIFAKGCYWWLRSMGCSESNPCMVTGNGNIHYAGSYPDNDLYAVRPAMWVRL